MNSRNDYSTSTSRTFREISTTANFHRKLGEKLVKSANNNGNKGQQQQQQNKRTSPLHTRPKVNNTLNGSEQSNSNTSRTNTSTTFGVNRKSSYKNKGE